MSDLSYIEVINDGICGICGKDRKCVSVEQHDKCVYNYMIELCSVCINRLKRKID